MQALVRIRCVAPLGPFRLRRVLTDGMVVERDVDALLRGPNFEPLRNYPALFTQAALENGTVYWPNGAHLCPGVLIRGGLPQE